MDSSQPSAALAQRAAILAPSATLSMIARVRDLQRQGIEILELTAGEPDFRPPQCVEAAATEAIAQGRGRYTPAAGIHELRTAVAAQTRREVGIDYDAQEIVVTNGAKSAIFQTLYALLEDGDEVIIPTPCWTSYPDMVQLAGGRPVTVNCNEHYTPEMGTLEAARTAGTKMLMLNTPGNPTGAVYPEKLMQDIAAWAMQHGIWVLSDEIYSTLVFHGAKHVSPLAVHPEMKNLGIWIGGMSKAYSMTGWRMGFLGAPSPVAKAVADLQSQMSSCPHAISQIASVVGIEQGDQHRKDMRAAFEKRSELVVQALRQMPGVECPAPQGAFYAFPRLTSVLGKVDPVTGRQVQSGDDLVEILIEADHVAVMGGTAFGDPTAFRISFAAADNVLQQALQRIANRLAALA